MNPIESWQHLFFVPQSYVSILYLRVPPEFRIILRGRDVEHHNLVNDMMQTEKITYRPKEAADGSPSPSNVCFSYVILRFFPVISFKEFKQLVDVKLRFGGLCNFLYR